MNSTFANAGVVIVQFLFGLLQLVFLLRILLQLVRANFFNPVSQFVVKVTNPVLIPLGKVLPRIGRFDLAAAVVLLLLCCLEVVLIYALFSAASLSPLSVLVLGIAEALDLTLTVIFFILILVVIFSWVRPAEGNPVIPLLYQLTDPIMAPARRLLPPIAGFDLSPMLVILGIYLLRIVAVTPLRQLALGL